MRRVLQATWYAAPGTAASDGAVAWARNWVLLDALMLASANPQLQPAVAAQVRDQVARLAEHARAAAAKDGADRAQHADAARRVGAWLADPVANPPRPLPVVPPGAPI